MPRPPCLESTSTISAELNRADLLRHWRDTQGSRPTTIADFCTDVAGDPEHPALTDYGREQRERLWLVCYQLCLDLANMGLLRPEGGTEDHVQLFVARMPWMEATP